MDKNTIKNTKNTIKNVLKKYGFTMIDKSFFMDDDTSCIFNMFDRNGSCYHVFIYFLINHATMNYLSDVMLHEKTDISYMFDDIEWGF